MSQEFRGFTALDPMPGDLYEYYRFADESARFSAAIVSRLGTRLSASRWNAGWDQRPGRDYFYANFEVHIRGRPDAAFFGFYHYREPARFAGSHWQVWEWEHDDEPIISVPVPVIATEVREATLAGRLGDYLTQRTDEIRRELGLH